MRCLVTGGAGFIGSHLTERHLAQGDDVVVLDDLSTGRADNLKNVADHPNLRIVTGSIGDPLILADAMAGTDIVYHMAAAVGVKLVAEDPVHTIQTNIHPTETLLRYAVLGGQKVYIASTSEVYGKNPKEVWSEEDDLVYGTTTKPRWAYGASKAIDEFLALAYHEKYGLPIVIGRFFNVVGPRQVGNYGMVIPRFVEQAIAGDDLTVYDTGAQVRCFAHVAEVVDCVMKLMANAAAVGGIFNIGSDRPVSVIELAKEVIARVGNGAIKHVAYGEAYGKNFEDVDRRVPSVDKLKSTIGQAPEKTLGEILDDIIAWKQQRM